MSLEACFALAGAVVVYGYVGYPVLLALASRLFGAPPVERGEALPPVTLIMVAHNEEARIDAKLRNCLALDYPPDRLEILVASDGSTDGTADIVAGYADRGVRLLPLPGPRGKATALNAAVPEAHGEVLVLCDVRQDLDPQAVRALVANLADPRVGAVSGELHLQAASASMEGVGLYWRHEKWLRRAESRLDSTVGVTGAIYALRRSLFRPLDPRTILDDVAIPMAVAAAGARVVFEPEARAFDRTPEDPRTEYRRKVRTLAGNFQLVALHPHLLSPFRNRLLWQFLSHKLLRLAVPWCLLALLVTSAVLATRGSAFYTGAFGLQLAFYSLATAGWAVGKVGRGSRLLSVPYSFTLLNLAAAASLFGFLAGREHAAWRGPAR